MSAVAESHVAGTKTVMSELAGNINLHLLALQDFLELASEETMNNCTNGRLVTLTDAAMRKLKKVRKAVSKLEDVATSLPDDPEGATSESKPGPEDMEIRALTDEYTGKIRTIRAKYRTGA